MPPNRFHWGAFSLIKSLRRPIWLALSPGHSQILSHSCAWRKHLQDKIWDWSGDELLFGYIPGISTATMQPRNSISRCITSKGWQTFPEMLLLKGDTNLTKEGSFSTTLGFKLHVSTPWNLHIMHIKGVQLRWPKYGWSNLNLSIVTLVSVNLLA